MGKHEHTPGPLRLGIWPADWDHVEAFRENLKYGSGAVWMVIAPEHPHSIGGLDDNPTHAVTTAITGNGPASEANAKLYAAAPELLKALGELLLIYETGYPESDYAAEVANRARAATAKARGE